MQGSHLRSKCPKCRENVLKMSPALLANSLRIGYTKDSEAGRIWKCFSRFVVVNPKEDSIMAGNSEKHFFKSRKKSYKKYTGKRSIGLWGLLFPKWEGRTTLAPLPDTISDQHDQIRFPEPPEPARTNNQEQQPNSPRTEPLRSPWCHLTGSLRRTSTLLSADINEATASDGQEQKPERPRIGSLKEIWLRLTCRHRLTEGGKEKPNAVGETPRAEPVEADGIPVSPSSRWRANEPLTLD